MKSDRLFILCIDQNKLLKKYAIIQLNQYNGCYIYELTWIYLKKCNEKIDNWSIRVYVNIIENIITFKVKTGYYLELLTPETMRLLKTKNKTIKQLKIKMVIMCHILNLHKQY